MPRNKRVMVNAAGGSQMLQNSNSENSNLWFTGAYPYDPKIVGYSNPAFSEDFDTTAIELDRRAEKKFKNGRAARKRRKPSRNPENNRMLHMSRSCTDVICGFLFALFLAAWGVLTFFAIKWGNPEKLLFPTDSKGRICGTTIENKYNYSDKPYVLFFDLTSCISYSTVFEGCPTPQICIEKCPNDYFSFMALDPILQNPLTGQDFDDAVQNKIYCIQSVEKSLITNYKELKAAVGKGECAPYTVASSPVVGRCIPKLLTDAGSDLAKLAAWNINNMTGSGANGSHIPTDKEIIKSDNFVKLMLEAKKVGEKLLADLEWASWQIFVFLVASGVLAFLWIVLMRWIAGVMVWISIILVVLLLGLGTSMCWWKYALLKTHGGQTFQLTINVKSYLQMTDLWLALSIIVTVVFVIIVALLIFLRSRIQIAIAMIRESSKAVVHIISALFFPIFPFLLQLCVFAVFLGVAAHLASWGVPNCRRIGMPPANPNNANSNSSLKINGSKCNCEDSGTNHDSYCTFVNYTDENNYVPWMQAGNLFALFWTICFIDALGQLTLAGAFASWYWAFRKPDDIPTFPLLRGFWRAIRYHLGSLAFGSLILAIVRMIRVVLEYIDDKLKAAENPVAEFFTKCLRCCFWCLEKFIKFLNKNAYIMIAIYGNNFCVSAKDAFLLLMRNVVRVFVLDKLTDFLLFLGKLVITVGFGVLSYYYFSGFWSFNDVLVNSLNFYFVPMIIVIVGTYMICCAFFGVYEMAVDTTFLCFLEDSERNDGTPEKPYFMSKNLMKILNKKNHFDKVKKKERF